MSGFYPPPGPPPPPPADPPLPPGWTMHLDQSGNRYYHHAASGDTRWNPPAPQPPINHNPSMQPHAQPAQSYAYPPTSANLASHQSHQPPYYNNQPQYPPQQQQSLRPSSYAPHSAPPHNPLASMQSQAPIHLAQSMNQPHPTMHHSQAPMHQYSTHSTHSTQPPHPSSFPSNQITAPIAFPTFPQSMSVGPGGAPGNATYISLQLRAVGLKNKDMIGKSDPVAHVYQPAHPSIENDAITSWKPLAKTEVLQNTVNPTWTKKIKVAYMFERHQPLKVQIIDVDNFKKNTGDALGEAVFTLAEVVRNGVARLKVVRKRKKGNWGELIIHAQDENAPGRVRLQLSLSGKNLAKMDVFGKSDPYYKLQQLRPNNAGTSQLFQSATILSNCNPTWTPHTIMLQTHMQQWDAINLNIQVYDWDKYTPHDLIGEARMTLQQLSQTSSFPLINAKKKGKKGNKYKDVGHLVVHRADVMEMPSFITYLQGGLKLDFVVAVDFTVSNRQPSDPNSLHHMGDPQKPSQYYQALQAIGTVVASYVPDQWITALGFGATLPGQGDHANFDFALSGNDPKVHGVQGLLSAYTTAISCVTLSGPTNMSPIIRSAMKEVSGSPVSQANQHFCVLLILTDGIVTDLAHTIDAIIEASYRTPIAIVIVGIGNADFSSMDRLDGDDQVLKSNDGSKTAKHDIVQFTKYDPTKPIDILSADVLNEVPQRVVEYMVDAGIKPNPPYASMPPPMGHPSNQPMYHGQMPPQMPHSMPPPM